MTSCLNKTEPKYSKDFSSKFEKADPETRIFFKPPQTNTLQVVAIHFTVCSMLFSITYHQAPQRKHIYICGDYLRILYCNNRAAACHISTNESKPKEARVKNAQLSNIDKLYNLAQELPVLFSKTSCLTSKANSEIPANLTWMFLDCGRKQVYVVETQTDTRRTC